VYPCVHTGNQGKNRDGEESSVSEGDGKNLWKGKKVILSINRFERKKNIELAVKAYAGLITSNRKKSMLIIAGLSPPRRPRFSLKPC
jgi:alpha-1,3/alpha-1,6-mannosyltransferase